MIPGQMDILESLKEASLPSGEVKQISVEVIEEKYGRPYPGSNDAFDKGCQCSVLNNFSGKGHTMPDGTIIYRVSSVCKIHGELVSENN